MSDRVGPRVDYACNWPAETSSPHTSHNQGHVGHPRGDVGHRRTWEGEESGGFVVFAGRPKAGAAETSTKVNWDRRDGRSPHCGAHFSGLKSDRYGRKQDGKR